MDSIETPVGMVRVGQAVRLSGIVLSGGKVTKIDSNGRLHVKTSYGVVKVSPERVTEIGDWKGA